MTERADGSTAPAVKFEGAEFTGRKALVTGGGSGIGRAVAESFVEKGCLVAVADIDGESARMAAEELGRETIAVEVDVSSAVMVSRAIREVEARLGGIDILVNNAGIGGGSGAAHEISEEVWDREIGVLLKSVYLVSHAAWSCLVRSGRGVIVNTASIAGLQAIPNVFTYCVGKAGVIMATRCLAIDGARVGVRANCVCPAHTRTPLLEGYLSTLDDADAARRAAIASIPLGRLGEPRDIADAMVFLASERARWITGTALVVDGGVTTGVWSAEVAPGHCTTTDEADAPR